jgi:cytochrome c553
MKIINYTVIILVFVLSPIGALAGHAETARIGAIFADRNCAWCHGAAARGFATAPQLAGQRQEYLKNQLLQFKNHTRDNPLSKKYMWSASVDIDEAMARELAVYFSTLDSEAFKDGDEEQAAAGRALYQAGIPAANIASCAICHGPDAQGARQIPRLGGQSYYYLKRKLRQWGEGYHATPARPMPGIATKLSEDQIEVLASYLSFVK